MAKITVAVPLKFRLLKAKEVILTVHLPEEIKTVVTVGDKV